MAIQTQPRKSDPAPAPLPGAPKKPGRPLPAGGVLGSLTRQVRPKDIMAFSSQLALMLDVGTPLADALNLISHQTGNPAFRAVMMALIRDVEEGRPLSVAMSQHPDVFDRTFVSMVKAGETGGFLKESMERVVRIRERRQALRNQLVSTLAYPTVLTVMTGGVMFFILTGVLPKFMVFFEGKEKLLPPTTRILMAMSTSLRTHGWLYAVLAAGLVAGLVALVRSAQGRQWLDWLAIHGLLIAPVCNKVYTCQMLRSLGHLMESHVPLVEALEVTRSSIANRHYRHLIDDIVTSVQQGSKFTRVFAECAFILPPIRQMVVTGEEVGNLSHVMLKLAEFYEVETEQELKMLASFIEPTALVVLGVVIGVVVSSVILPMFKLAQAMA